MVRPERELLKGEVEVDETYLAISDRDKPLSSEGRKSKTNKILVAIAVEILQPKGFGRIRLRRIDNDSDACVVPFVQDNIEPGARVRTDGSAAYRSLSKIGFEHTRQVMLGASTPTSTSSSSASTAVPPPRAALPTIPAIFSSPTSAPPMAASSPATTARPRSPFRTADLPRR